MVSPAAPPPAPKVKIQIGAGPAALMERRDAFVLVEGPAGTGKTFAILSLLLRHALYFPGMQICLCRQTRESLTDSVLKTFELEVFPAFGMEVPGGADRANRSHYKLDNGSTFALHGLNEPTRLYGTFWDRVYIGEAIEAGQESIEKFGRAMRARKSGYQQVIMDTNPGAPGHWLNQACEPAEDALRGADADYVRVQEYNRFSPERGKYKRIITSHRDNPGYWNHNAQTWTQAGQEYLETWLRPMTGHVGLRMFRGLWVAASGTVFPEFSTDRHVFALPEGWNPPSDWPQFVGYDPGFDHPTCVLWICVSPDDRIFVWDEIYQGGRSVEQHCAEINARNIGRTVRRYYGDPQEFFSRRSQGPSCADQAVACGLRFQAWPGTVGTHSDGSRGSQGMVEAVRKLLMANRLVVSDRCKNTIMEFQSWSYKRTSSGDVPAGDDAYEDRDNHAMDVIKGVASSGCLRYQTAGAIIIKGE